MCTFVASVPLMHTNFYAFRSISEILHPGSGINVSFLVFSGFLRYFLFYFDTHLHL